MIDCQQIQKEIKLIHETKLSQDGHWQNTNYLTTPQSFAMQPASTSSASIYQIPSTSSVAPDIYPSLPAPILPSSNNRKQSTFRESPTACWPAVWILRFSLQLETI